MVPPWMPVPVLSDAVLLIGEPFSVVVSVVVVVVLVSLSHAVSAVQRANSGTIFNRLFIAGLFIATYKIFVPTLFLTVAICIAMIGRAGRGAGV